MTLFLVGIVLAALGIVAALLLVAAPLGLMAVAPGLSLWVLFPLFTLVGYTLLVIGSRDPAVKAPTAALAAPLPLVSLAAAVGLVASGAGLIRVDSSTGSASLWYVLALGGVLGAIGSAVTSRPRS